MADDEQLDITPAPHPGGRPSLLTEYTIGLLLANIRKGHSNQIACKLSGVSYRSFARWMQIGRRTDDPNSEYWQFWHRVTRAKAERIDTLLDYAEVHAKNDPKTAMQLLGVYLPSMFAKPETRNVNMNLSGEVQHNHRLNGAAIPPLDRGKLLAMLSRPELPEADEDTVDGEFSEADPD